MEVGDAAMLRDLMTWMMWRVSVGKLVTSSLKRRTRQELSNYIEK